MPARTQGDAGDGPATGSSGSVYNIYSWKGFWGPMETPLPQSTGTIDRDKQWLPRAT